MDVTEEWLPARLPGHWRFPAPPVCSKQWSNADWVRYAAPYNKLDLAVMRLEHDYPEATRARIGRRLIELGEVK